MQYRVDALRWRTLDGFGVRLSFEDARTLYRAARTLQRWYEAEAGDSAGVIFRDESGKPFRESYSGVRVSVRDRETGAMKQIDSVCKRYGLAYKTNHDPRGHAVYLLSSGCDPDKQIGVPVDV
jgi:hypothetical protein